MERPPIAPASRSTRPGRSSAQSFWSPELFSEFSLWFRLIDPVCTHRPRAPEQRREPRTERRWVPGGPERRWPGPAGRRRRSNRSKPTMATPTSDFLRSLSRPSSTSARCRTWCARRLRCAHLTLDTHAGRTPAGSWADSPDLPANMRCSRLICYSNC